MTNSADYSEEFSFHQDVLAPVAAWCDDTSIHARLESGVVLKVPLWWYPEIGRLSFEQRNNVQCTGFGLFWPTAEESITIEGMLSGWKSPNAVMPVMAAE